MTHDNSTAMGTGTAGAASAIKHASRTSCPPKTPPKRSVAHRWAIVLAVAGCCMVGVTAVGAVPSPQDARKTLVLEAQVREGLLLASGVKVAVAEYYNNNGRFPPSNASAGLAAPEMITGEYVSLLRVGSHPGVIEVAFSSHSPNSAEALLDGKTLALMATANDQSGVIRWSCGGPLTTIPQTYLPATCQQSPAEIEAEAKLLAERDQTAAREHEEDKQRREAIVAADMAKANARAERARLAALAEQAKAEHARQLLMQTPTELNRDDAADDTDRMADRPLDCAGDKATLAIEVANRLEYPAIGEFDQALCKAMPDASGTTIVALSYKRPGDWCSDDDSRCGDYDLDVLLVDTTTLAVKARWQKKAANTSDADQFGGIRIDTGQYWLAKGVRGFGIRADHYAPSHAVTASDTKLNLYIRRGNKLHAVVDGLTVRDEHESASDSCVEGVATSTTIVRMGTNYHHGLRDIATRTTSTLVSPQPDNGPCHGATSSEDGLLKYDGDHYHE